MEISESTWAFIAKHRREDVRDVALHAKHDGDVDVPFALEQIAGWQRASLKLPDWASHDGLIFPPQVPMEQCSSQFTAQYKARLAQRLLAEEAVDDDSPASLVDLTGGFGVDFLTCPECSIVPYMWNNNPFYVISLAIISRYSALTTPKSSMMIQQQCLTRLAESP